MPDRKEAILIDYYTSPIGELILGTYAGKLCLCDWKYRKMRATLDRKIQTVLRATYLEKESEITRIAQQQFEAYFSGNRKNFELPLLFTGTDFQQQVWDKLLEIPYGKTCSYLELSKKMGDINAIRAVAAANGANTISIIIPCHRVVGTDGALTGYAGGLRAKKYLLDLERKHTGQAVQMKLALD